MSKRKLQASIVIIAGCIVALALFWTMQMPAPFSMQVIPESIRGESIPGQRVVFLVVVEDEGRGIGEGKSVDISAEPFPPLSAMITIYPDAITPGQVAEITVIPDEDSAGGNITVTFRGEREGLEQIEEVTFGVLKVEPDGEDGIGPYAEEIRDKFVSWLAVNHPELGITNETEWIGTIVSPQWLVVSHYLFFSEDWEMHVSWHVMIPPHDWARIDLRRRYTESVPSYAFEISSLKAQEEPHAIEPPESVWR